jgi:hypothetical protein
LSERIDPITAGVIARMDEAKAFLEAYGGTVPEVEDFRRNAAAYVEYFKHCETGLTWQNVAAKWKIACERRLGELLGEPAPRGRPKNNPTRVGNNFGINADLAAKFRKMAAVPEVDLLAYYHDCESGGQEITSFGVLKLHAALNRKPRSGETVNKETPADSLWKDEPPEKEPADEILSDLTRLTRKLTLWINSPDGAKFKDYLLACKLGHFLDARDITVRLDDGTLKTLPVRWKGFGALRWFVRLAAKKGLKGPEQVRRAFEDAKRDDPDAGVWSGDVAEGEVPE